MKLEGKVRGVVFQTDAEYVKANMGEEGLRKVRIWLDNLGYPLDYERVKSTELYPIGLRMLSLMAIKEVFNLADKDIVKMGNAAPKYSFVVRIVMKYLVSIEQAIKFAPRYYKKHVSIGEFQVKEYNPKENYVILRLQGMKVLPLYAKYLEGYFTRIFQYVLTHEEIKCQQLKSSSKGEPYDEYKVFW
jgi:hypothetical protein